MIMLDHCWPGICEPPCLLILSLLAGMTLIPVLKQLAMYVDVCAVVTMVVCYAQQLASISLVQLHCISYKSEQDYSDKV